MLPGRVSHSGSGERRVPYLRKSSMVWIWQHDKRTDDYKIILNCARNLMKNKWEKEGGNAQALNCKICCKYTPGKCRSICRVLWDGYLIIISLLRPGWYFLHWPKQHFGWDTYLIRHDFQLNLKFSASNKFLRVFSFLGSGKKSRRKRGLTKQ